MGIESYQWSDESDVSRPSWSSVQGWKGSLFRYRFLNLLEEVNKLVEKSICTSEDDHLLSDNIWIPLGRPIQSVTRPPDRRNHLLNLILLHSANGGKDIVHPTHRDSGKFGVFSE